MRCNEAASGQARQCEMFQRLSLRDSGERVLEMAIGFPPDKKRARGVLVLPLGILLNESMTMQIDNHDPFAFKVRYCVTDGCYAFLSLPESVLELMKAGAEAQVNFKGLDEQDINLSLSLNGFTNAIHEIGGGLN